jgi:hypothetical protein
MSKLEIITTDGRSIEISSNNVAYSIDGGLRVFKEERDIISYLDNIQNQTSLRIIKEGKSKYIQKSSIVSIAFVD